MSVPQKNLGEFLLSKKDQVAMVLPSHIKADRFMRLVFNEIKKTPKLQKCTRDSLMFAIMNAAQYGLLPGLNGQCYLLPYEKKENVNGTWQVTEVNAQFILGYKGMVELIWRSGKCVSITAQAVYSNDKFKFSYGLQEECTHEPSINERGDVVGAYVIVRLKDGAHGMEYMPVNEINKIRDKSVAYQSWVKFGRKPHAATPWETDYAEMCKKTVLRRLFKYMPVSVEAQELVAKEELIERGITLETDYESETSLDEIAQIMDSIPFMEEKTADEIIGEAKKSKAEKTANLI